LARRRDGLSQGATGYTSTELEIGRRRPGTITNTALFGALLEDQGLHSWTASPSRQEARLRSSANLQVGAVAFDKFSSAPFIMDAIRSDGGERRSATQAAASSGSARTGHRPTSAPPAVQ
jgi:hypothetical protein